MNSKLLCIDHLYAVGGYDLSSVERYDPFRDEWYEIAPMTIARLRHQAVAFSGSIYAIGKLSLRAHCQLRSLQYQTCQSGFHRLTCVTPQ